ncbi:MAG: Gfo/Idh/MocA family oxidoreductase [Candidatus Dormibacteraeota bacterium]|uniref:Gfo/Idh/MocA family oxidoreductase n=1 Tax=Candidatus Aeolococcus gillhamiae TaxID=3127015 RepID=A0A934K660_9BACT|nr:Gfo/Idh/MocA family oxidoreductase [Candidatus Dormibacteraeota bacterium]
MIGVGLVGTGYWGINLCRSLAQNRDVRLTWLCDQNPAALARASKFAPAAQTSSDLDRVLEDQSLDAVVLATPAATHAPLGLRALAANKHLLVEKPLAMTTRDAEGMCREAERRQLILMVGHTYLYNPAVRRIKEMLEAGELGDIRYASCQRLNLGIVRSDVDALWNLAPHDLSMLEYWLGHHVTGVAAVGHAYLQAGVADVAFAHLWYEGGASGHIHVSWLDPAKARRATVVGSKRMLIFDDMSADMRLMVFDKGIDAETSDQPMGGYNSFAEHRFLVRAGDAWMPRVDGTEPLALEVAAFVDSIKTGRRPLADGRHGAAIVKTLERISGAMMMTPPRAARE